MIRYPISQADLEKRIEEKSQGWLEKAAARTEQFRKQGCYKKETSIWNKVKLVYMNLQGNKCAYCERQLEGPRELDMEHFRPKRKVKNWQAKEQGITPTEVSDENRGYYLLPYHIFNYVVSCKQCNSDWKKNYFPIAGDYDLEGTAPEDMLNERAYLIYPLGDFDDAPEDLIHFHGVSPQASAPNGYERERALVTIELFKLDDVIERENLLADRANFIVAIYPYLEKLENGATGTEKADAQEIVDGFTSSNRPHTNCIRSFKRLFEKDRTGAKAVFDEAVSLFNSGS